MTLLDHVKVPRIKMEDTKCDDGKINLEDVTVLETPKINKSQKAKHCSGYNMFFKDLIASRPKTKESFAEIAKSASQQWRIMTPTKRKEYYVKAEQHCIQLEKKLSPNQMYQCEKCGKTANHHKDLIGHEKECGKIFPCKICGAKFKESRNLNTHMKCVHDKIKTFKCITCEQKFAFKKDLERHQVVHNGKKPYTCETCSKSFSWQSNMKRHKKVSGHV